MYYRYFRGVIKNQGVPNLNNEQLKRMLDIAYFEGALNLIKDKQAKTTDNQESHKYSIDIINLEKHISKLLNYPYAKETPKSILNSMLSKSRE